MTTCTPDRTWHIAATPPFEITPSAHYDRLPHTASRRRERRGSGPGDRRKHEKVGKQNDPLYEAHPVAWRPGRGETRHTVSVLLTLRPPAMRRLLLPALLALFATVALGAGRCYPEGTRVIVFLQGLYTTYDADGTQGTAVEEHRFETLKSAFEAKGYKPESMLDFSYAGGAVTRTGDWNPTPYRCEQTDMPAAAHVATLEKMLADYRAKNPGVHFALVGHSLGGYVGFLAGARDAARPPAQRLGIDVVVTMDSPLLGASADKKVVLDLVPCGKTYQAGGELVAAKADPATPDVRRYQAAIMAREGVRLATLGNVRDCLWNTAACIGGTWIDDSPSQFLEGQAATSLSYSIETDPLSSHDVILADAVAVKDAVTFVGAP